MLIPMLIGLLGVASLTAARADVIIIVTQSVSGAPINALVEKSRDEATWVPAQGQWIAAGRFQTEVDSCGNTIRYRARDDSGMYVRSNIDSKICSAPEVVFNDFEPVLVSLWKTGSYFSNPQYWNAAFGNNPSLMAKSEEAATLFSDAIAKGDYGSIALVSTELSAQLRKAGNPDAARYWGALAIDATTRGAMKSLGEEPGTIESFVLDKNGVPLMSSEARETIATYQKYALPDRVGVTGTGNADWATIRSLDGGKDTNAVSWKFPTDALQEFKAPNLIVE